MFPLMRLLVSALLTLLLSFPALAGQQGELPPEPALLKVYFDVNIGIGQKLETRLRLINTTYDQLVEQGYQPQVIIGFRGPASFFVTKGEGYVEQMDLVFKNKIAQWLTLFTNKGIRMEQCRIAAGLIGIETGAFRPEVVLVDNGYVAMIVYQHQGFSYIPMD